MSETPKTLQEQIEAAYREGWKAARGWREGLSSEREEELCGRDWHLSKANEPFLEGTIER